MVHVPYSQPDSMFAHVSSSCKPKALNLLVHFTPTCLQFLYLQISLRSRGCEDRGHSSAQSLPEFGLLEVGVSLKRSTHQYRTYNNDFRSWKTLLFRLFMPCEVFRSGLACCKSAHAASNNTHLASAMKNKFNRIKLLYVQLSRY